MKSFLRYHHVKLLFKYLGTLLDCDDLNVFELGK